MKAIYNNKILAESDNTIVIEGNHYFPPESVNKEYFTETITRTTCPWKGEAYYYTIDVDGDEIRDSDWYYPHPKDAAKEITNHVAFYGSDKLEV
jgi:uncharacterized protein (DUF427 family)